MGLGKDSAKKSIYSVSSEKSVLFQPSHSRSPIVSVNLSRPCQIPMDSHSTTASIPNPALFSVDNFGVHTTPANAGICMAILASAIFHRLADLARPSRRLATGLGIRAGIRGRKQFPSPAFAWTAFPFAVDSSAAFPSNKDGPLRTALASDVHLTTDTAEPRGRISAAHNERAAVLAADFAAAELWAECFDIAVFAAGLQLWRHYRRHAGTDGDG